MAYLLFGAILAGLLLLLLQWWANAEVASAKRSLMWGVVGICVLLAIILLATGKAILAAVPAGYALLRMAGPALIGKLFKSVNFDRSRFTGRPPASGENMSRAEALEVLGLKDGASEGEINEAYRRLMGQVHPDKGGSDWMAAKLNAARQTLLD